MISPLSSVVVALRLPLTAALLTRPSLAALPRFNRNPRKPSNLMFACSFVLTSAYGCASAKVNSGRATAAIQATRFIPEPPWGSKAFYMAYQSRRRSTRDESGGAAKPLRKRHGWRRRICCSFLYGAASRPLGPMGPPLRAGGRHRHAVRASRSNEPVGQPRARDAAAEGAVRRPRGIRARLPRLSFE